MGWNALTPNSLLRTLHLKKKLPVLAPGPTPTLLGGAVAPDTSSAMSAATIAAKAAAQKQRKKAGAGSLLTTAPVGTASGAPAVLKPATLIGGYR